MPSRGEKSVGEPNGKVVVRMPIELHKLSVEHAARNGVSLNQWLVSLIAGGQNFKLPRGTTR